jgi:hypothetical protein
VILDQVQMFDQQVAPARPVRQQRANFFESLCIDLAALWRARWTAAAAALSRRGTGGALFCNAHYSSISYAEKRV